EGFCFIYFNTFFFFSFFRNSLNDDLLLPYPPSEHGPRHHHRYVRNCQAVVHGNLTHEIWASNKNTGLPVSTTRVFVSKFDTGEKGRQKVVYGHVTVVNNPSRTVSVLEPGRPGGCSQKLTRTVEETAKYRKCLVAQNGGYFNTVTGECLGNIVSDGKLVHDAKGIQNAQFGIRKDGTLVFGYLSEEDVLDTTNPFIQLVSGVVWLLRNRKVYIKESKIAECDETQKTGDFDKFITVVSARTAVGHDAEGRLILFHADGQTDDRGLTLWELADFLKSLGVVNAINLDGGGSATLVLNGSLASYPSDHCMSDSRWRCPRSISTIVCVHEPDCEPQNCNDHGQCVMGECSCFNFWTGPACNVLDCGLSNCSLHGICTLNGCLCDAGWAGSNCSDVCLAGFYGDGCSKKCDCKNGGTCDHVHGFCTCPAGYYGNFCEQECPLGWYGPSCQQTCKCENMCPCHPETGSCNITYQTELNETLYKAGYCRASQIFVSWKEEFISEKKLHVFTQKSWMIITATLVLLFLISLLGNLIQLYRHKTCSPYSRNGDYYYQPLSEANGKLCDTENAESFSVHQTDKIIQERTFSESTDFL
uniref:N-acetylglucosamine-1-phosphodiester alpha-N-acetylglucosaminidase n=1 Tax=Latimeria chalumnae TaxID=7897 RepID=H2ZY59_LATCH